MTIDIQPPTAHLPPIRTIENTLQLATGITQLLGALQYLRTLYVPQVRGSRRRRQAHDVQRPQSDAFERAYAIRWLTALIARLETGQEHSTPPPTPIATLGGQSTTPQFDLTPMDDTNTLLQQATSLLAICAGVAAAGRFQRRFTFHAPLLPAPDGGKDNTQAQTQIDILLTDIPLDNHDYASVGAQTWGGACVLAEMIAELPERFGLCTTSGPERHPPLAAAAFSSLESLNPVQRRPLRILELGAGTGLVGLTVAKLLRALPLPKRSYLNPNCHPPQAAIVLTDFYPPVLDNLQSNIRANFPSVPGNPDDTDTVHVYSHTLDWSSFPTMTKSQIPDILSTPFDIIFGADIIYEAQHAVWIRDCLSVLLARPCPRPYPNDENRDDDPMFHLVIPLRSTHALESSTVEAVFGAQPPDHGKGGDEELIILSKESILCEAYGDGRDRVDDDVEYVYYRIGWSH